MTDIRHPRIRNVKRQIEWTDGTWRHVIVVTTDLSLDSRASDYDSAAVNELVNAIGASLREADAGYQTIRIEEAVD